MLTIDPAARLAQANGNEATGCFLGHILAENRNGLCVDLT